MLLGRRLFVSRRIQSFSTSLATHNQPSTDPISSTQANHVISNKQLLYTTDRLTPGSIFFLPHGTRIFNKLVNFMKNQQTKYGFQEVISPLIYKNELWKQSGHWDNYKEDMFKVVGNDLSKEAIVEEGCRGHEDQHEYGLKPMNCPGHCLIFSKFDKSYSELPVRYSDFSSLHRNEASGALSGLTRVRRFHQDDGHIFCTLQQIHSEITNTINLIKDTYGVFGIDSAEIEFFLSTRPEKYIGEIETWDEAENQLRDVLNATAGHDGWQIREQDGAFYGPKIDILLKDAFDKKLQVGTIQLDFQLPSRFALQYTDKSGQKEQPIMIHRAVFGSLERFFAILLDHYQGAWPFWLNPRQALIVPVSEKHVEAAKDLQKQISGDIAFSDSVAPITGYNFYVDIDSRDESVGTRIKDAVQKKYSYILMIGDKDIEKGTVAVRTRESRKVSNMTPKELKELFVALERNYK
ncbi:threonine-tRNA_ligase [Candidozyma auris]|uniref:threonine--tRNA ligase MST1 n=1 Tax=Candidozyma auris TaxID=498019 RepID=UPI000D2A0E60|nr:threonine-tRNA_ligase [[Candida] auris]QEO20962.1 threonine-tRNA_ligase [[Candida] auris]GBL48524.1 threonine--tRNA ligase [[Candida] auris]